MIKIYFLAFLLIIFPVIGQTTQIEVLKKDDNLFLVMEKIDKNNIIKWENFAKAALLSVPQWQKKLIFVKGVEDTVDDLMQQLIKPLDHPLNKMLKELTKDMADPIKELKKKYAMLAGIGDGSSNFIRALGNFKNNAADVWVAYISSVDPRVTDPKDAIEIAMTVSAKEGSPVSMHMGIFRNPDYMMSKQPQHAKVSPELHAYAAKIAMQYYPALDYMVTTPLASMANIFKEILPKESYAEGFNKKDSWIIRDEKHDNKPRASYEDGYKFILYDRDVNDAKKQEVLSVDDKNKDKYLWFLAKLHDPIEYPYFAVRLKDLVKLLK